ncbi:unnamed protein product [Ostreobium quekettii]|uniref:40S ribosomal protein S25 n=1 Tax=Ostreobium quekettii TaxID=121088 RepID=A0A8S1J142_9CHLO|nr:unnamed protein product [Ostreobium quekettii]
MAAFGKSWPRIGPFEPRRPSSAFGIRGRNLTAAGLALVLQKWSKGKVKEKVNNMVVFDKATHEKLMSEVPTYRMITPSVLSDRLRINGSLARAAIRDLLEKGVIREVSVDATQKIYTRATNK